MRAKGQKVEATELAIAEERMRVTMETQAANLKHKQDQQLSSLLKRIQRDRDE